MLLDGGDRTCATFTCKTFKGHMSQEREETHRSDFLRTRALAAFACMCMPHFIRDDDYCGRSADSDGFYLDEEGGRPIRRPALLLTLAARLGCMGALEVLLIDWVCYPSGEACDAAAEEGNLEALVWLHSNDCPLGELICFSATQGGHLDVLQYALECGGC